MDFGRLENSQLSHVDFSLPKEPDWNKRVLTGYSTNTKFHVGTPKWGKKEWLGKLYPKGTKDAQFLDEYVKHFNAIELAATHYKLYDTVGLSKWVSKVNNSDFLFYPKVYQGISHFGILSDKQFLTDTFLQGIRNFGAHLGPIMLQVSDKFAPKRTDELFNYLKRLPKDLQFFVEVRHPDWFQDKQAFAELLATLKDEKIGLVITDTPGRRDVVHMHLTISQAYIRFVCIGNHPTDYERVNTWMKRLKYWKQNGLAEAGFFIHNYDETCTPEFMKALIHELNVQCDAGLKEVTLLS